MSDEAGRHIRTNEKRVSELLAEGWKPPAATEAVGRLSAGGFGQIGLHPARFHLDGPGAILARSALLLSRLPRIPRLSAPSRLEPMSSAARGPLNFPALSSALRLHAMDRDAAVGESTDLSFGRLAWSSYPRASEEYPKLVWTWGVGSSLGDLEPGEAQAPLGIESHQIEPGEPEKGDPRYSGGRWPSPGILSAPYGRTGSRLVDETSSGAGPVKPPEIQRMHEGARSAGIRIDGHSTARGPVLERAESPLGYTSDQGDKAVLPTRGSTAVIEGVRSSVVRPPLLSRVRPSQLATLAKRQENVWFGRPATDVPAPQLGPQLTSSALPFEALPLRKPADGSDIRVDKSPSDRRSKEGSHSLLSSARSAADRVLKAVGRVLVPKGQAGPSVGTREDAAPPGDITDLATRAATSRVAKTAQRGDREEPRPLGGDVEPWSTPDAPSARASGARSTLESREEAVQSRIRETRARWRSPRLVDVGRSVVGVLRSRATGRHEVREPAAAIGGVPESAGMPGVDRSPLGPVPPGVARPADLSAQRRTSSGQVSSTRPRSATARSEASLRVAEKAVEPGALDKPPLPPHAADNPDRLERVDEVAATTYSGGQTSVEVSLSRSLPIANRLLGARMTSRWIGPQESTVAPTGLASRQPRSLAARFDHPTWPRPTAGRMDDTRVGSPWEPEIRKSERWEPVRAASFVPSHEPIVGKSTENESAESARPSEAGRAEAWAEIERPVYQARSQRRRYLSFLGEDAGVLDGAELVRAPARARADDLGIHAPDATGAVVGGGRSNWINLSLAPADRAARRTGETPGAHPDAAAEGGQAERGLEPKEIDELSNTVYRLLKQRLAVERERAVGFRSEFFA